MNRKNEIVCIAHLLLNKIMIYSFISLPFCPDQDPDTQIYADPDPGRAKTCGSVRIRIIRIRNPAKIHSKKLFFPSIYTHLD